MKTHAQRGGVHVSLNVGARTTARRGYMNYGKIASTATTEPASARMPVRLGSTG